MMRIHRFASSKWSYALVKVKASQAAQDRPSKPIEEAVPTSSFADVARKITDDDEPPPWLMKAFERWALSLAIDRGIAVKQPTKAKTRKSLQAVKDAAHTLIDALNDGAIRGFLDEAPDEIPYHGPMDHMLRDLARRAGESAPSLANADGTTKPGRNRAMPRRACHSKSYCAAMIAEAWSFFYGNEPSPKNQDAAAAAQIFWNGSAGIMNVEPAKSAFQGVVAQETKSWGSERLNGWRRHFEQAKDPALSKDRAEFRRHLKQGKHKQKCSLATNRPEKPPI
jgi:hypothetical protein